MNYHGRHEAPDPFRFPRRRPLAMDRRDAARLRAHGEVAGRASRNAAGETRGDPLRVGTLGRARLHGVERGAAADGLRLLQLSAAHLSDPIRRTGLTRSGCSRERAARSRWHRASHGRATRLRSRHVRTACGDVSRRRSAGGVDVPARESRPARTHSNGRGASTAARGGRADRGQRPQLPQPAHVETQPHSRARLRAVRGMAHGCRRRPEPR